MDATLAHQEALTVIDRQIGAQASVLAFSKLYLLSGAVLLGSLVLLFLFRTGRGRGAIGAAH
jgi:DHA2 family multidrug resistance protein